MKLQNLKLLIQSMIIILIFLLASCAENSAGESDSNITLGGASQTVVNEVETNLNASVSASGLALKTAGNTPLYANVTSGISSSDVNSIISALKTSLNNSSLAESSDAETVMKEVIKAAAADINSRFSTDNEKRKKVYSIIALSMVTVFRNSELVDSPEKFINVLNSAMQQITANLDEGGFSGSYSDTVLNITEYSVLAMKKAGFSALKAKGSARLMARALIRGYGNISGAGTGTDFQTFCKKLAYGMAKGIKTLNDENAISGFNRNEVLKEMARGMGAGVKKLEDDSFLTAGTYNGTNVGNWIFDEINGDSLNGTITLANFKTLASAGISDADSEPVVDNSQVLRIFVSSNTYQGNLGGISGADSICNGDAKCNNGKTCKAMLGLSGVRDRSNDWVLQASTTYFREDGSTEIFTTNANAEFDLSATATFTNSISTTTATVYTGIDPSNTDWVFSGGCSGWTDNTNVNNAATGTSNGTGSGALRSDVLACDNSFNLYCVEQP